MAQISEKIVRGSLGQIPRLWFEKFQNIHCTTTPADFIALGKFRYLIEVKEVSVYKGYKSFAFDRLTQEADLINFEAFSPNNISYIFLNFREKTMKKSSMFLIPIKRYMDMKELINKKSANINDIEDKFVGYKLTVLPGSVVDLSKYII